MGAGNAPYLEQLTPLLDFKSDSRTALNNKKCFLGGLPDSSPHLLPATLRLWQKSTCHLPFLTLFYTWLPSLLPSFPSFFLSLVVSCMSLFIFFYIHVIL